MSKDASQESPSFDLSSMLFGVLLGMVLSAAIGTIGWSLSTDYRGKQSLAKNLRIEASEVDGFIEGILPSFRIFYSSDSGRAYIHGNNDPTEIPVLVELSDDIYPIFDLNWGSTFHDVTLETLDSQKYYLVKMGFHSDVDSLEDALVELPDFKERRFALSQLERLYVGNVIQRADKRFQSEVEEIEEIKAIIGEVSERFSPKRPKKEEAPQD